MLYIATCEHGLPTSLDSIPNVKTLHDASLRNTDSPTNLRPIIFIAITHRTISLPRNGSSTVVIERWRLISNSTVQPCLQHPLSFTNLPSNPISRAIITTLALCEPEAPCRWSANLGTRSQECISTPFSFFDEQSLLFHLYPLGSRAATIYMRRAVILLDSRFSQLAIVKLLKCCMEYPYNNPHMQKDKGSGKSGIMVCEPSLWRLVFAWPLLVKSTRTT